MRDRLIHIKATVPKGDDFEDPHKEGDGVFLNGHLLYWWDHARDGPNDAERLIPKLQEALDPAFSVLHIKVRAWWVEEEIEACVRGLLAAGR